METATLSPSSTIKSSSTIGGAQYDLFTRKLTITFLSGSVYEYAGVPSYIAFGFTVCESLGKFFAANIRGFFPYERVS